VSDDPLREAVKRLRGLRSDVERLKSGGRAGGVLRMLRRVTEPTVAADTVETGPDAEVVDETEATDTVATGPSAVVSDDTSASDATGTTTGAVEQATWDDGSAWGEDYWD